MVVVVYLEENGLVYLRPQQRLDSAKHLLTKWLAVSFHMKKVLNKEIGYQPFLL